MKAIPNEPDARYGTAAVRGDYPFVRQPEDVVDEVEADYPPKPDEEDE